LGNGKQERNRKELTSGGEKRKLPIKAAKERAAGFGRQRRGGGCEPREESAGCSSGAGRKKAIASRTFPNMPRQGRGLRREPEGAMRIIAI
jgi:hypothetical protein